MISRMAESWRELGGLPRSVWMIALANLVNRAGTMVLPYLALYLTRAHHMTAAEAGQVLAVYGLGSLIASPVGGQLVDRFGATRVMNVTMTTAAGLLLLYPSARSPAQLVVVTLLWSLVAEAFRPASMAFVGIAAPRDKRKQAFALTRLAVNLGMSIGPLVGGFLVSRSFSTLFWVDGLTSLAAAALIISFVREPVREDVPRKAEEKVPARAVFADIRFRWIFVLVLCIGLVFMQLFATMPLYLVDHLGLKPSTFGLIMTVNTLLIVVFEVPFNSATASWSHALTMALGSALMAVGFGALALVSEPIGITATVVIMTVGEMLIFPGSAAFVTEIAPAERQGQYMGLYAMSFGLAHLMAPWLGTLCLERLGASALWGATFVMGAVATVLSLKLRPTPPNVHAEPVEGAR
jgi:MFS family permease